MGSVQGGSGTPPLSPKGGAKSPIVDRKAELGIKFDDKNFDLLLKYNSLQLNFKHVHKFYSSLNIAPTDCRSYVSLSTDCFELIFVMRVNQ